MADVQAWDSQFQINLSGSTPQVIGLKDGSFVAVWTNGTSNNSYIEAQVLGADGLPKSQKFSVATGGMKANPSVTALADGGFVVTWEDHASTSAHGAVYAVPATGAPTLRAAPFEVAIGSPPISNNHANTSVTALPNGGFVVSVTGNPLGATSHAVANYLYDSTGQLTSHITEFSTSGQARDTAIATLQGGAAYVTVASSGGTSVNSPYQLVAKVYATGTAGEIKTINLAEGYGLAPTFSVTTLQDGGFVVVWSDINTIQAKIFNANGTGGDTTIQLYRSEDIDARMANVAVNAVDGGFALAFQEDLVQNGTVTESDILVSTYDFQGQIRGATTKAHGNSSGLQVSPSISTLQDGRFVVSWNDGTGLQGRIFDDRQKVVNIYGTAGNDSYYGTDRTDGRDTLDGGLGDDTLNGGAGDDVLIGSVGGNDIFSGGTGRDIVSYYGATSIKVYLDSAYAKNSDGAAAGDTYISIEGIDGTAYDDTLEGNADANSFWGDNGNDILKGHRGDDMLAGGAGNDTLVGGEGNDRLEGGEGADRLEGGAGTMDWASYELSTASTGLTASLENPNKDNTGEAKGDSYYGIEGLVGTTKSDTLIGDVNDNQLWGSGGDDLVRGNGGNDSLWGSNGADTLYGGTGNDFFDGEGDRDVLTYTYATAGVTVNLQTPDKNRGEARGDTYINIEVLEGSLWSDELTGRSTTDNGWSSIDDEINAGYGRDTVYGGAGNDALSGGHDHDLLLGGTGQDTLQGNDGDDTLEGGAGNDSLDGGEGLHDFASYANAGGSIVASLGMSVTKQGDAMGDTYVSIQGLIGSQHDDRLFGSDAFAVELRGEGGDDELVGASKSDTLEGGAGADILNGGGKAVDYASYAHAGSGVVADLTNVYEEFAPTGVAGLAGTGDAAGDRYLDIEGLIGSAHGDTLYGDAAANHLRGLGGSDVLVGRGGADTLDGGTGHDTFYVDSTGDKVIEYSRGGTDTVRTSVSFISSSSYEIEKIIASGRSNVSLEGNGYANYIYGNSGQNKLWGGLGKDYLKGGSGKDTFVFDTKATSANKDKIADFKVKDDTVWLDNKYFKKLGPGTESRPKKLDRDFFTVGSKAEERDDHLIYNDKKGVLYYDADGSGRGKAVEVATLSKNLKLKYTDFYVI